ncbi:MAG: hypothetical protein K2V38_04030 [Gemmataceae bacterium]|nr:hypothetical protein [Gemmataceae bacterium]
MADARLGQAVCFDAVAKLIEKQQNAEAFARADNGFKAADGTHKSLTDELARLREQKDVLARSALAPALLEKIQQNLDALKAINDQLAKHVEALEKVVKAERNPAYAAKAAQAEAINTRISVLLGQGDIDEALAAYDLLFTILTGDVDIRKRRDALKAEWEPKDDAHRKARDYLLKEWPKVSTVQDFKDSLPTIRAMVDVCQKVGDKHGLRKLLTIFGAAAVKLNDLVAPLDPANEADKKLFTDANEVGKEMAKLEQQVRDFVNR